VIRGETTSAAPPTISGNVKKNGLFSAPVSSTSSVANVIATLPSTTNFAVPSERGGRRSWTTSTKTPANARRAKIASWSRARARDRDDHERREDEHPADDPDDAVVRSGRDRPRQRLDRGIAAHGVVVGGGPFDRVGRAPGLERAAPADQRRDDHEAHDDEVREDGDQEKRQDGLEVCRHRRSILTSRGNACGAPDP
jgi:hypothetical protein